MEPAEFRNELASLHDSAFGWAMVCCGYNRDLAADVLQQSYCRVLAREASFAGRSEFSTWVFGVVRNVAYENLRNSRRRSEASISAEVETLTAPESGELDFETRELADQIAQAMTDLPDRQRELLHLTFYEDMTVEQAAHCLKISVGSARQHYQRGKAALKHRLAVTHKASQ